MTSITLVTFLLTMVMYVDDSDIFITVDDGPHQITRTVHNAQQCINMWKRNLQVTGGVVRPDKCSLVLIDFEWYNGEYKYKSIRELPATIKLDDEQGQPQILERIEPTTGVKSLGVYLQVDGSDHDQIKYMLESITAWLQQLNTSFLPANMNLQAMFTRISRTLIYLLSTTIRLHQS